MSGASGIGSGLPPLPTTPPTPPSGALPPAPSSSDPLDQKVKNAFGLTGDKIGSSDVTATVKDQDLLDGGARASIKVELKYKDPATSKELTRNVTIRTDDKRALEYLTGGDVDKLPEAQAFFKELSGSLIQLAKDHKIGQISYDPVNHTVSIEKMGPMNSSNIHTYSLSAQSIAQLTSFLKGWTPENDNVKTRADYIALDDKVKDKDKEIQAKQAEGESVQKSINLNPFKSKDDKIKELQHELQQLVNEKEKLERDRDELVDHLRTAYVATVIADLAPLILTTTRPTSIDPATLGHLTPAELKDLAPELVNHPDSLYKLSKEQMEAVNWTKLGSTVDSFPLKEFVNGFPSTQNAKLGQNMAAILSQLSPDQIRALPWKSLSPEQRERVFENLDYTSLISAGTKMKDDGITPYDVSQLGAVMGMGAVTYQLYIPPKEMTINLNALASAAHLSATLTSDEVKVLADKFVTALLDMNKIYKSNINPLRSKFDPKHLKFENMDDNPDLIAAILNHPLIVGDMRSLLLEKFGQKFNPFTKSNFNTADPHFATRVAVSDFKNLTPVQMGEILANNDVNHGNFSDAQIEELANHIPHLNLSAFNSEALENLTHIPFETTALNEILAQLESNHAKYTQFVQLFMDNRGISELNKLNVNSDHIVELILRQEQLTGTDVENGTQLGVFLRYMDVNKIKFEGTPATWGAILANTLLYLLDDAQLTALVVKLPAETLPNIMHQIFDMVMTQTNARVALFNDSLNKIPTDQIKDLAWNLFMIGNIDISKLSDDHKAEVLRMYTEKEKGFDSHLTGAQVFTLKGVEGMTDAEFKAIIPKLSHDTFSSFSDAQINHILARFDQLDLTPNLLDKLSSVPFHNDLFNAIFTKLEGDSAKYTDFAQKLLNKGASLNLLITLPPKIDQLSALTIGIENLNFPEPHEEIIYLIHTMGINKLNFEDIANTAKWGAILAGVNIGLEPEQKIALINSDKVPFEHYPAIFNDMLTAIPVTEIGKIHWNEPLLKLIEMGGISLEQRDAIRASLSTPELQALFDTLNPPVTPAPTGAAAPAPAADPAAAAPIEPESPVGVAPEDIPLRPLGTTRMRTASNASDASVGTTGSADSNDPLVPPT